MDAQPAFGEKEKELNIAILAKSLNMKDVSEVLELNPFSW